MNLTISGLNLGDPLRWECEDPKSGGVELSLIPRVGMVLFYDSIGPVLRMADIADARWRCTYKINTRTGDTSFFRVTVLKRRDESFINVIPGIRSQVIHCTRVADHDGCPEWYCARVGERLDAMIA